MSIITSKSNPKIKETVELRNNPGDLFVFEGYHLLEMAISSGSLVRVFSSETLRNVPSSIESYLVSEDILRKISLTLHPEGVVGVARRKKPLPFLSKRALILDEISDPGNMGTILRGALAFGFSDVLLLGDGVNPFNSKAIMSSQGAIFSLNIERSSDARNSLLSLKKNGYSLIGTDLKSSIPLGEIKIEEGEKLALVLGNESRGVSPLVLSLTDKNIRIEMSGIDSLNVAMAGSILMYHLR